MNEPILPAPEGMVAESEETTGSEVRRSPIAQLHDWQEHITHSLLVASVVIGLVAVAAEGVLVIRQGRLDVLAVIVVFYAIALFLTLVRRLPFRFRAVGFLLLFYSVSLFDLTQSGLSGDGRLFFLAFPLLALILLGKRAGVVALLLSLITIAVVGVGMATGLLVPAFEASSAEALPWVTGIAIYLLVAAAVLIPPGYLITNLVAGLSGALEEARQRWHEVRKLSQSLEQQVTERTADLSAASEVARQTAVLAGEQELMNQFVNLVGERFALYNVGLFLLGGEAEYVVLRAASSEGGQRLVKRGYRVRVGSDDPVGQTARSGDVRSLAIYQPSLPELPQTRWRVTLPLQVGSRIAGVLDVHFSGEQPPSEERSQALRTLADQLAVGLENARLLAQARTSLEELTSLYRMVTTEAWQQFAEAQPALSRYRVGEAEVAEEAWEALFAQARGQGGAVSSRLVVGEGDDRYGMAVPVKLRGVPIGIVGFHRSAEAGEWRPEEIAIAEAASERMALALENARLLEETRGLAARERVIREIADQMQQATDLETLVRITAEELNRVLGGSRAYVRMATEASLMDD
jgi:GAF domain-containing protein